MNRAVSQTPHAEEFEIIFELISAMYDTCRFYNGYTYAHNEWLREKILYPLVEVYSKYLRTLPEFDMDTEDQAETIREIMEFLNSYGEKNDIKDGSNGPWDLLVSK
jgi:hypothetical protein